MEADLTALMERYGFGEAAELVAWKRRGERSELSPELSERWKSHVGRAFDQLDAARERSVLPEEPQQSALEALEAWLLEVRRSRF